MKLFDTHCHLCDEQFDNDRFQVLERMQAAGVAHALLVADATGNPQPSFDLAHHHDFLWAAVGVHPQDALRMSSTLSQRLAQWLQVERVVALGEIGLDYHYETSPRKVQREVFDEQLEMAYALNKPVILHIRDAHGDATDLLTARARQGRLPSGVMHCYTGSWESAKTYLDMGLYLSFTGAVTFKNAPKLTEVAGKMPLDRLMVETDCPYMAPVPLRGRRNEPAFVAYTAQKIAAIREMDAEELALHAYRNGCRLFDIPEECPTKHEFSCGAVLYTRTPDGIRYVLVIEKSGQIGLPKGHREMGETEAETALREIREETGIVAHIKEGEPLRIQYAIGKDTRKHVAYFTAEYEDQTPAAQLGESRGVLLLSYEQALRQITYPSVRDVFRRLVPEE